MPQSFRFVHLADVHGASTDGAAALLRQAVRQIHALDPPADFVVTGGDLVEDATPVGEPAARLMFGHVLRELAALQPPLHHCLGNHDLVGVDPRSGLSPADPGWGRALWRELIRPDTSFSFDHGGWHVIVLDDIDLSSGRFAGGVEPAALEWLRADLAATGTERPIALITHLPLGSFWIHLRHGPTHQLPPDAFCVNAREVYLALRPCRLKLVLAGHTHVLEQIRYEGTLFVTGGALRGGWGPGPLDGPGPGFGVVDVHDDEVTYRYELLETP